MDAVRTRVHDELLEHYFQGTSSSSSSTGERDLKDYLRLHARSKDLS